MLAVAEQHGQSADLPFAARAVNPTPGPTASRPRASHRPAIVDRHDDTSSEDEEEVSRFLRWSQEKRLSSTMIGVLRV